MAGQAASANRFPGAKQAEWLCGGAGDANRVRSSRSAYRPVWDSSTLGWTSCENVDRTRRRYLIHGGIAKDTFFSAWLAQV